MRTSDADILIIPGLGGSGPDHWQSRWEVKLSTARRVEQKDWERPRLADWRDAISTAVAEAERPVILVAHSLGAITVADIAAALGDKVKGAFLVAPPSLRSVKEIEAIDPAFADIAAAALPFPSVLVASRDDPYASFAEFGRLCPRLAGRDRRCRQRRPYQRRQRPWPLAGGPDASRGIFEEFINTRRAHSCRRSCVQ